MTPGGSTIVVGCELSPQLIVTVLVWLPPGLTIVPLAVTVPYSSMLDDESTSPGRGEDRGRVADGDAWSGQRRTRRHASLKVTPTL